MAAAGQAGKIVSTTRIKAGFCRVQAGLFIIFDELRCEDCGRLEVWEGYTLTTTTRLEEYIMIVAIINALDTCISSIWTAITSLF